MLKVTCVADTHSRHLDLGSLPPGDILIHAGDLIEHGSIEELHAAFDWLSALPYAHKILVAGNHDYSLEPSHQYRPAFTTGSMASSEEESAKIIHKFSSHPGIVYLHPTNPFALINVGNQIVKIFGFPYTPLSFGPNAFMRERALDTWAHTPDGTDIIVSHSPPFNVLDINFKGRHMGCKHLMNAIERVKPKLVVCGHVHEARGIQYLQRGDGVTTINNAAVMDRFKRIAFGAQSIIIPLSQDRGQTGEHGRGIAAKVEQA